MKYVARFDLITIDKSIAPKAEELDREVEDAISSIDVEGMEINTNTVVIERAQDASDKNKMEMIASFAHEIERTLDKATDLELPWEGNPKYTIRQMMKYWLAKLQGKEIKE